ncbi:hypothetical protein [Nocardia sp. NPDC051570]|uniref:effector-associated constant component EACC1 n=1 Tax=Nocardia sp. NPDC051570 TaxID=3364324 RepID=UPI0037AB8ADD
MQLDITVNSDQPVDDLISLSQWLRRESELASGVAMTRRTPSEEELGGAWDLVTVSLGSGGTVSVLAASLSAWFRNRPRTIIKIKRGEESLEIDTNRAKDLPELLRVLTCSEAG